MASKWVRDEGQEWGPWVMHDGKGCPLQPGVIVEVVCQDGFGFTMKAISVIEGGDYSSWDWRHYPELKKILRYREKKPKGLSMLEESLQTKDAPSDTPSDIKTPEKHTAFFGMVFSTTRTRAGHTG